MELEEFIHKTLVDIRNGLRAANEEIAKLEGGELGKDKAALFQLESHGGEKGKSYINFDIAVTVNKETGASGGSSIRVPFLSVGGEINGAERQEYLSRIKFALISGLNTG
jgi:hypothetical protein